MSKILSDEEINNIEKDCWKNLNTDNCIPFSRAIEQAAIAAYEKKLREVEPVGYLHKAKNDNGCDHLNFDSYDDEYGKSHWDSSPLYLHPAPSAPEALKGQP